MASEYQERFQFKSVQLFKDQVLGIGAYGKVCLARCDLLLCAAKIMHETLFDPSLNEKARPHHEHRLPFSRFKRECEFLSVIRHPNIVQYLGMCRDPDTHLPVLLMELMDSSLSHFLEDLPAPLPFHIQVNICHDIVLALFFLHSNGVIHRDLSGNNVLMIGNVRAKVTDFGMASLIDPNRLSKLTRTMCPGTDVYMPPEAIDDPPVYTEKIDCFAFGVILVQILTRLFPSPTSRKKKVKIDHPGLPEGVVVDVPVPEIDRRQDHIKKIQPNHPLLSIAIKCLSSKSVDRPSSEQLYESISALKEDQKYRESTKTTMRAVVSDSKSIVHVAKQVEDTSAKKLQDKERQLEQAKHQLEEGQQIIQSLQNRIEELELVQKSTKQRSNFKFSWKGTKKAPCEMYRGPDAVVSGYMAYFRPTGSRTVYMYDVIHSKWNKLTDCPNDKCSLVIIGDLLTTVGGVCEGRTTNQLLSLVRGRGEGEGKGEGRWPGKWEENFPSMSTRRCRSSVLYVQRSLLVAGGVIDGNIVCNTVEILNIDTHNWTTAACLPEALYRSSMAVCGNSIYLLGGFDKKNLAVRAVLVCPIDLLLKPRPSFISSVSASTSSTVWSRATDLSVTQSTCVSLRGQLLAVGGMDIDRTNYRSADIRMYDSVAKQWEIVGRMSTPRRRCYAAVLLEEHLMVVGGLADNGRNGMDAFEIANVTTVC